MKKIKIMIYTVLIIAILIILIDSTINGPTVVYYENDKGTIETKVYK